MFRFRYRWTKDAPPLDKCRSDGCGTVHAQGKPHHLLYGCGLRPKRHGICVPAGFSENENHNRDQIGEVECTYVTPERPTEPAPRIVP